MKVRRIATLVSALWIVFLALFVFKSIPPQVVPPVVKVKPTPKVMTVDEALTQIEELFETPPDWKQRMIDEINREAK